MKVVGVLATLLASCLSKDMYLGNHKTRISQDKAQDQFLDCYDYANQGGNRLRAIEYIPQLSQYNFNNIITSCCITGIWIMYADDNYNNQNIGAANWWVYGDNFCTNVPSGFDNQASSLRYTGAPDAWNADTLNLYNNEFFIGGEEYFYGDVPQLNYDNQAKSLIVTGCSGWTVYDGQNYQGNCKCVWPSDTNACYPGFYSTEQTLGSLSRSISSARRGCFCSKSVLPDNHGAKTSEGGAAGFFNKGN